MADQGDVTRGPPTREDRREMMRHGMALCGPQALLFDADPGAAELCEDFDAVAEEFVAAAGDVPWVKAVKPTGINAVASTLATGCVLADGRTLYRSWTSYDRTTPLQLARAVVPIGDRGQWTISK